MKNDYIIRLETPSDYAETENTVREAFWNVYRPGCTEHFVLHNFRTRPEFVPQLDYVMEKGGKIIGQIMYVRTALKADDGREIPVMTFGPIGILPEYKRQGYGKALLDYTLQKAAEMGAGAVCMEGNIDFYGKSGFVEAETLGIYYEGIPRGSDYSAPFFLAKQLKDGALDGVPATYATPEGYMVSDADAEAFDATFPPKQKQKLPGQIFGGNE